MTVYIIVSVFIYIYIYNTVIGESVIIIIIIIIITMSPCSTPGILRKTAAVLSSRLPEDLAASTGDVLANYGDLGSMAKARYRYKLQATNKHHHGLFIVIVIVLF